VSTDYVLVRTKDERQEFSVLEHSNRFDLILSDLRNDRDPIIRDLTLEQLIALHRSLGAVITYFEPSYSGGVAGTCTPVIAP
jgi:hypothetical protein